MTVHYATVSENIIYEKWKNTEDLELFKVNTEPNELTAIDTTTDVGENLSWNKKLTLIVFHS